jgi:hypothetical protein
MSCEYPEGCSCGASAFNSLKLENNNLREQLNELKEIIWHAEIHSNFKRSGYREMTCKQKEIWDKICESKTQIDEEYKDFIL